MKISVVIPCYNAARTIGATLNSVFRQTLPPDEILALDDGSTDNTVEVLNSYQPRITVLQQENRGVSSARNALCYGATGDLIAFLDSDDIWHPRYIEVQARTFEEHPNAVAFFTGHVDFCGEEDYQWESDPATVIPGIEVMPGLEFFKRYNRAMGSFASLTYCCIAKRALSQLAGEPFRGQVAEDCYLYGLLSTLGPVVFTQAPLAAYRIHPGSLSSNRLWSLQALVQVFQLLEESYENRASMELRGAFRRAFASSRRSYAKHLMGAGETSKARAQIRLSFRTCGHPISLAKSWAFLLLTYMPDVIQPAWPSVDRVVKLNEPVPADRMRTVSR